VNLAVGQQDRRKWRDECGIVIRDEITTDVDMISEVTIIAFKTLK